MVNRRYLLSSSGAALALAATWRRAPAASTDRAPHAWRNLPFGGGASSAAWRCTRAALFRSDDAGASFRRLDDARQRLAGIISLAADPLEHGTVYVGTRGRGVFIGNSR